VYISVANDEGVHEQQDELEDDEQNHECNECNDPAAADAGPDANPPSSAGA